MKPARIRAVIAKEARELARDPVTIWVSLLLPIVMLLLFGYAVSLDVEDVPLGVLDGDHSPASRRLTDSFTQSGYFRLVRMLSSEPEVERALQRGDVKLTLIIPERFQAAIARGEEPTVQILLDGTYSATSLIIAGYAQTIVGNYGVTAARRIRIETRIWYNAAMRSSNYIIPGLYGVILMAFSPLLTALSIVREKETGSIQQIFASPLTPAEFIAGKLIPYGLIAFLQIVLVMAAGFFWFDVPFRGNLTFLLAMGLVYVFCTVGIGLLVSTITRSQLVAMLTALIITLMPSFLFSGFLFPIFTMPYTLQLYTNLFPSRYFVELSRGIVLKGAGIQELWLNTVLLAAYTIGVFLLAAWRFRKKVA